jgi:hypothetical protein
MSKACFVSVFSPHCSNDFFVVMFCVVGACGYLDRENRTRDNSILAASSKCAALFGERTVSIWITLVKPRRRTIASRAAAAETRF